MSFRKAIVIPFNPHLNFWGGSAIGSLTAHKMFADQHGAVFWDLARASSYSDVGVAYFYDTEEGAVTFKAKVEFIEQKNNINPEEEKYITKWRKANWKLEQTPGQVWLKLRDIFPLEQKRRLSDFQKVSDDKELKRVQNFAIVKDPSFEEERIQFTVDRFIDDYVYRLASQENEKLQETNIEEMLWFLMLEKNLEFVERQKGRDNRIDIAFKGYKDYFVIVEIKKGTAGLEALRQIKKYMKKIGVKRGAKKLLGIILCRKADIRLQKAVKNEKDISIDEYEFSIDFPRIKELLANH